MIEEGFAILCMESKMRKVCSHQRLRKDSVLVVTFILIQFCVLQHQSLAFVPGNLLTKLLTFNQGRHHVEILERALLRAVKQFFNDQLRLTNQNSAGQISTADDKLKAEDMFKSVYGGKFSSKQFEANVKEMKEKIASVDANDKTKKNPKYHFDAERFVDGNNLVITELSQVITLIQRRDYATARQTLGILFHTFQDFYSHSNWVEIHEHRNIRPTPVNQNLGVAGAQIGQMAAKEQPTCLDCDSDSCRLTNLLPDILNAGVLTSGYSVKQHDDAGTEVPKPLPQADGRGKCSHGSVLDSSSKDVKPRGGINKDAPLAYQSPHRELHEKAAIVAEEATLLYLNYLRRIVGDAAFGQFLTIAPPQPNVAMVAPTGGNGRRRRSLIMDIVRHLEQQTGTGIGSGGFGNGSRRYSLTYDNDATTVQDFHSAADFVHYLNSVQHKESQEGSTAEATMSLQTILTAVRSADPGSSVFVFSSSHRLSDQHYLDHVSALARSRHVKINFVGDASNIENRRIRRSTIGGSLAKMTGGLSADTAIEIETLHRFNSGGNMAVLLRRNGVFAEQRTMEFNVDRTVTMLSVLVQSDGQLPAVYLRSPLYSVQRAQQLVDTNNSRASCRLLQVRRPIAGAWKLEISDAAAPWDLRVHVTTSADFSYTFLRSTTTTSDHAHDQDGSTASSLFTHHEITSHPIAGELLAVLVSATPEMAAANCSAGLLVVYDEAGGFIESYALKAMTSSNDQMTSAVHREYFIDKFVVPRRPFLLSTRGKCSSNLSGTTKQGDHFQRTSEHVTIPTSFSIESTFTLNLPITIEPGTRTTLEFRVASFGTNKRVRLHASDQLNILLQDEYPRTLDVEVGKPVLVPLTVAVPESAIPGSSSTITVVATVASRKHHTALAKAVIVIGPKHYNKNHTSSNSSTSRSHVSSSISLLPPTCKVAYSNSGESYCSKRNSNKNSYTDEPRCEDQVWVAEIVIEFFGGSALGRVLFDSVGGRVAWNFTESESQNDTASGTDGSGISRARVTARGHCCVSQATVTVFDSFGLKGECILMIGSVNGFNLTANVSENGTEFTAATAFRIGTGSTMMLALEATTAVSIAIVLLTVAVLVYKRCKGAT